MSRRWFIAILLLGVMFSIGGCAGDSAQPPQMMQLCLRNDGDANSLIATLERVARENNMIFVDRSRQSHQELIRLEKDPGYRIISVSASRSDGLGISAGNLGLGAYEVVIGVTSGANSNDEATLGQVLMNELKSGREVRIVPAGQGAMPSGKCKPS